MTTIAWARSVAVGCVNTLSAEYQRLSTEMCWTAAYHVALLAGIIDQAKYNSIKGQTGVLTGGQPVANAAAMDALPGGYLIYFVWNGKPIHAMVSTGNGRAAGNKNDCVGVGRPLGWEDLDLRAGLEWGGPEHILAPLGISKETGQMVKRNVSIFAFPITDLAI